MLSFATISHPVSEDSPCGPDPELDPEILNFLAVAEGQLPATYREFNRKAFDARPLLSKLQDLLERSRDLRLLVLSAKFNILSDNLAGFVDCISAIHALLLGQWEACHPTASAGGNPLRAAHLKTLDDLPTSVLPMQNATLITDKRLGTLTWRSILVAGKKLPARPDETPLELDSIRDALMRFEPVARLNEVRDAMDVIVTSLQKIKELFVAKAGFDIAPSFDQLPDMALAIKAFLAGIIAARNPQEEIAESGPDAGAEGTPGAAADASASLPGVVASVKEASSALEAILAYYAGAEPSSPARLMVKQAHQLVGKSFVEAMRVLAPALAETSTIHIGGDAPFALDFTQMSALAEEESTPEDSETEPREFAAKTRAEATTLMRGVEQFYKRNEPSSPIPLLVEKARTFVAKDFTSLLKEMVKRDEAQS